MRGIVYTSHDHLHDPAYCKECEAYWCYCMSGHFIYKMSVEEHKSGRLIRCEECEEPMWFDVEVEETCPACAYWNAIPYEEWVVDDVH